MVQAARSLRRTIGHTQLPEYEPAVDVNGPELVQLLKKHGGERLADARTSSGERSTADMSADRIYRHADFYTIDDSVPRATAVAITDGEFSAVGSDDDVNALRGPDTEVIDLDGAFVVPGMGDLHQHWDMAPLQSRSGWFSWQGGGPAPRPAQLRQALSEFATANPDREWLIGSTGSWYEEYFEQDGETADAAWLDSIVVDRPVALQDVSGHNMLVNTLGMERAELSKDTPTPPNGTIRRDEGGNPVGIFSDGAQTLVMRPWPLPSHSVHVTTFADCANALSSLGLTMVKLVHSRRATLEALYELDTAGRLPLWVDVAISWKDDIYPVPERWDWLAGERFWYRSEHVNPHSVKWHHDGTTTGFTAYSLEPYVGRDDYHGKLHMTTEETIETIEHLDSLGISVVAHTTADGSARHLLDAIEEVRRRRGNSDLPHTLSHCIIVDPVDQARFAELNVVAEVGGTFMYENVGIDQIIDALGERVRSNLYPVKGLVDAGAVVIPGSDLTIGTSPAPLEMLENYVTRRRPTQTLNELPESKPEPLGVGISLEQALRIVTINCAYATGSADRRGSITVGKSADMVVLDRDLFAIAPETISHTRVVKTVLQGREVWDHKTEPHPLDVWELPYTPGVCDCAPVDAFKPA